MVPIYRHILSRKEYRLVNWDDKTVRLRDEKTGKHKKVGRFWLMVFYRVSKYYAYGQYHYVDFQINPPDKG